MLGIDEMKEYEESLKIVYKQTQETVKQELSGITVRLAIITCPCGQKKSLVNSYRCLYCKVMFCDMCAEEHFGKTVEEYRNERKAESSKGSLVVKEETRGQRRKTKKAKETREVEVG